MAMLIIQMADDVSDTNAELCNDRKVVARWRLASFCSSIVCFSRSKKMLREAVPYIPLELSPPKGRLIIR